MSRFIVICIVNTINDLALSLSVNSVSSGIDMRMSFDCRTVRCVFGIDKVQLLKLSLHLLKAKL